MVEQSMLPLVRGYIEPQANLAWHAKTSAGDLWPVPSGRSFAEDMRFSRSSTSCMSPSIPTTSKEHGPTGGNKWVHLFRLKKPTEKDAGRQRCAERLQSLGILTARESTSSSGTARRAI